MKLPLCPICKHHCNKFITGTLPLFQCINCRLIFQSPLPKGQELKKFYENSNYFSFWGNRKSWSQIDEMKEKSSALLLKELTDINIYSGKLLDVGCARGALLNAAKKIGFSVYGIEPSKESSVYAKKISGGTIYNNLFEDVEFNNILFGVVVFFDSLEHFPDINSVVQKCGEILAKNGHILISTPDTDSLSYRLLGKSWPHFKKEHLYYFNKRSIQLLLKKNGFEIFSVKPSLKVLTLNYVKSYFESFNSGLFAKIIIRLLSIVPKRLLSLSITIHNGNMLILAKKK